MDLCTFKLTGAVLDEVVTIIETHLHIMHFGENPLSMTSSFCYDFKKKMGKLR